MIDLDLFGGGAAATAAVLGAWKRRELWAAVKAVASAPFIIERVAKEFAPNGGNSLRDRIDQIHNEVTNSEHRMVLRVEAIEQAQDQIVLRLRRLEDA